MTAYVTAELCKTMSGIKVTQMITFSLYAEAEANFKFNSS
jgi:hypothetical protein